MKFIGEYFYIVVVIIAIIISVLKQNKARQRTMTTDPSIPDEDGIPSITDWFNSMTDQIQNDETPVTTAPEEKQEKKPKKEYFTYDSHDQAKPEKTIKSKMHLLEETEESHPLFEDGLDMRKAVLYSEILKRPQY